VSTQVRIAKGGKLTVEAKLIATLIGMIALSAATTIAATDARSQTRPLGAAP
jgi:hypothetical protein